MSSSCRRTNSYSLDRSARRSQRSGRAHSAARFDESHHQSRDMPEINARDYTMTLPASRGRHRSRINRKIYVKLPWIQSLVEWLSYFYSIEKRAQSVGPQSMNSKYDVPILCNTYAIDDFTRRESLTEQREQRENRARSMPRSEYHRKSLYSPSREVSPEPIPKRLHPKDRSRYLAPPLPPDAISDNEEERIELEVPVKKLRRREKLPPSPRIMSPMGFAIHRQARLMAFDEESNMNDDDYIDYVSDVPVRPVPIWLCVFLVIGYIIAGAFYFTRTEKWEFLDSAYFCFITLTTIGECCNSSIKTLIYFPEKKM